MVIGDGVLTPAISVLSAVSGLQVTEQKITNGEVVLLACVILLGLFALQHIGTHRVAFMFAPIVIIWLVTIFALVLYNTIHWNPKILRAISPYYIIKCFRETGKDGGISLGGILLAMTGTEAMFADLGHFTALSIRVNSSFYLFYVQNKICVPDSVYWSICVHVGDRVFWPVFMIATLAAIVGSQAVITATFSIIKQCHALGCFPRVKVVHTSKHIYGQIYIPEINWILMILCVAITIGFQDTTLISNAYGKSKRVKSFVFVLYRLHHSYVCHNLANGTRHSLCVEQKYFFACSLLTLLWLHRGCLPVCSIHESASRRMGSHCAFMLLYGCYVYLALQNSQEEYNFDLHNKASLIWLLGLGPSLGIVQVPGIGLIYSELATGVPAILSHFVTNLPAFHKVLVFVCVKFVPVPFVSPEERFLIGRICPRPYRMYRCMVRMAVISTNSIRARRDRGDDHYPKQQIPNHRHSVFEDENPQIRRRVRFLLPQTIGMDPSVREELMDLIQAKEAGIAYIMGHSYVKARRSPSFLKKLVIDIGYSFLRKNCRGPSVALNIPTSAPLKWA
ncbi:hypothetical protein IFM89_039805 [Coptis chinensis]|uniref:Potassium transporter n=1 Tax=Coptis chinensis TaxID=261450 RepID=A0A835GXB4_9MAGN|nr:hypothetical protein IFM89_039805 [Coptis chinensis]